MNEVSVVVPIASAIIPKLHENPYNLIAVPVAMNYHAAVKCLKTEISR